MKGSKRTLLAILMAATLGATLGAPQSRAADGEEDLDEILGVFDDEDPLLEGIDDVEDTTAEPTRFWDLSGSLTQTAVYNYRDHLSSTGTDYSGLARMRTKLNLQLDLDLPGDWTTRFAGYGFYDANPRIRGRGRYTDDVLHDYEWDLELQEAYLQGSLLPSLDFKLGRQVVNWGRSDTLRILDVLNPLDNREPGLVDLEDLRRGVSMARLDYYVGDWSVTAIGIPEIRFDRNPSYGSDFYPALDLGETLTDLAGSFGLPVSTLESLFAGDGKVHDHRPSQWGHFPEWGIAVQGIFSRWDISFHAAQFHPDSGQVSLVPVTRTVVLPFIGAVDLPLAKAELAYPRISMVGVGGNVTFGSWLVKTEVAYLDDFHFDLVDLSGLLPTFYTVKKSRLDAMIGVEYYGINDVTLALEVANRHIRHFEGELRSFPNFAQRNSVEIALRATVNLFNEKLEITMLGIALGERAQDGSIVRVSADYELAEALEVGGGVVLFQEGDLVSMSTIGRNDHVFLRARYSF